VRTSTSSILLLIVVIACLVSPALAQTPPGDGRFVVAGDGSTWVITAGLRQRIQGVAISDADLAQLTEGAPVSSLADIGLAAAPPPAAPATVLPAAAPNPPATLLGQSPRICKDGTPFRVEIAEAEWTKTLGDSGSDGAMWVLVVASVTNQGSGTENIYRATQLRDERARAWADVAGTADAVHIDYAALATQRGAQVATAMLRPGVATRVLLVYGVAADAQRLELVSIASGC
jgi:hypothetical protein